MQFFSVFVVLMTIILVRAIPPSPLLLDGVGGAGGVGGIGGGIGQSIVERPLQWSGGIFEWPCPSTKSLYKSSGKYVSKNVIATRAQIYKDDVFLALPRYKSGVSATLVKTTIKEGSCQAVLSPFPSWTMQEEGNCRALQSIVDLVLDQNDILWVLDIGVVNTLENPIRTCQSKVVALSVRTGKVLKTITFEGLITPASRLQYMAVEYNHEGRCFVYISDAAARAIIVFDVQASRGFRVILPKAVTAGASKRDVLYMALAKKSDDASYLYFTYLSATNLYAVKTEFLQNAMTEGRIIDVGAKPTKQVLIGTDNGSNIFFRNEGDSEVFRWDTNTPFEMANFRVVYRCQTCQLATHAMADYKRGKIRVLESNFPDYMQNTVGCGATQQLSIMQGPA